MDGRRVVLGVGAGIAAYKVVALVRLFKERGAHVRVIPTPHALKMVGATTWAAISGNPVHTSVFDDSSGIDHVATGAGADLIVVAPATADLISKIRIGAADNLLGATLLSATCPVLVVPAMHTQMWENPATAENVSVLRTRGINVMEPAIGALTSGDSGKGRMPEVTEIFAAATELLTAQDDDLTGMNILISAGGTREEIDPVRFLGNHSSGRQGCELAKVAAARGAKVTLVAANIEAALLPVEVEVVPAPTAAIMAKKMREYAPAANIVIMSAAVADFRPKNPEQLKIKKTENLLPPTIELEQTEDILASLTKGCDDSKIIVGFAAETGTEQQVLAYGKEKVIRKGADLLAVNRVGEGLGFGDVKQEIWLLNRQGHQVSHFAGSKKECARKLLDTVVTKYKNRKI